MQKTVFISGGSKGIGLELVKRFSRLDYQVITCSRNESIWNSTLVKYPEMKEVEYHVLDISNSEAVQKFYGLMRKRSIKFDIVVNNASPEIESEGSFHEVSLEKLKATLLNDLWGPAQNLKYQIPMMNEGGTIVNVSSINGLRATPGGAMYSAAKHGVEGLTHSLALEAIKLGIRINSVAPGVTWTPRWEKKCEANPSIQDKVSERVPAGRFAKVEEIANAIEWLASSKSSYVVGHTLVVDGGLSLA